MEVYGEKPKRFTKEWWPYFWMYYKLHVIVIAFVVLSVAFALVECSMKVDYDFTVLYMGKMIFTDEQAEALTSALSEQIDDVDGDGVTRIDFTQLTVSGADENIQYDYTITQKFDIHLTSGDTALYLMSEEEVKSEFARQYTEYVFEPIENWADTAVPRSATIDHNGVPTAISLKGSTLLESLGFYTDDLYLVVRIKEDGSKDIYQTRYDAAVQAANLLIEGIAE